MKKIKQWIQNHKKEILVGAAAAGITASYFLIKNKGIRGLTAGINLRLEFLERDDEWIPGFRSHDDKTLHFNYNLTNPDLKIGDLGKLGEEIRKIFPLLTEETPVSYMNASYRKVIESVRKE